MAFLTPSTLRLSLFLSLLLLLAPGCDVLFDKDDNDDALPTEYVLPGDQTFPEGITVAPLEGAFYVGSTTDGTIYRGDIASGEVAAFSEGGPAAIGLAASRADHLLWVAGGPTGSVFVIDRGAGDVLAQLDAPPAEQGTFLNDVALTEPGTAYVTDSVRPVLFRAHYGDAGGALEPWLDLTGTPIEYQDGFNLNGIVATPGGHYLIVVQSNTGQLFRIDTSTKAVQPIDVGGADLTNGDGLLLKGRTLFVVRNQNAAIVPVHLSDDLLSGTAQAPITDASFRFPTTVDRFGGSLFVVNGQLDAQGGEPVLPFTVSRVPLLENE